MVNNMKYVHCDNCNCKISKGSEAYRMYGRAGLYCSAECYGETYAEYIETLTDDIVDDCYLEFLEDDSKK